MPRADSKRFAALFSGRTDAWGTAAGGVIRGRLGEQQYQEHLDGRTSLGIFPLTDDNCVRFAAIDLDEPDYDLAYDLASFIPGTAWIERSRSDNAHVLVFFKEKCPAWVARGQLRWALKAAGREDVEVFPKQAELLPGMVGNYLNLAFYGDTRPIVCRSGDEPDFTPPGYSLEAFIHDAETERIDPEHWLNLCRQDGIEAPNEHEDTDWGTRKVPHRCALYMLKHAYDNPVVPGHRNVVFFSLAKMLLNCESYNTEEVEAIICDYSDAGTAPVPYREIRTIVRNAERGRFTSTGCDDPLMSPYADPECKIAHG